MCCSDRAGTAGFTLVEVMISLVVTSMLLGILYSALGTVARTWDAGSDRALRATERRAGFDFMRRELAQLAPAVLRDGGDNTAVFSGEEQRVVFLAPIPSHRDFGGLFMVAFEVVESSSEAGDSLIFKYRRFDPEAGFEADAQHDDWKEKTLLEGIKAARFGYLAEVEPGALSAVDDDNERWQEDGYPAAVTLALEFADGSDWPTLTLPVHAHAQAPRAAALLLSTGNAAPGTTPGGEADPRDTGAAAGADEATRTARRTLERSGAAARSGGLGDEVFRALREGRLESPVIHYDSETHGD